MKTTKNAIYLILAFLLVSSCKEDVVKINPQNEENENLIKLGKQLENPYTIENMRKAYSNLTSGSNFRLAGDVITIEPNYKYVQFAPQDSVELAQLENYDTALILFDYPLDYEIENDSGDYYRDPLLPESVPTYQYTAVPIEYELPNIPHKILSELFLPDEEIDEDYEIDTTITDARVLTKNDWLLALEDEALAITGNLEEDVYTDDEENNNLRTLWGRRRRRRWNPSGRIRYFDDAINRFVPVHGVRVKAHRWFKMGYAYTNSDGVFWIGKRFRSNAKYNVKFKSREVNLVRGIWPNAVKIYGGNFKGQWNADFTNQHHTFYCQVHNAAKDYFFRWRPIYNIVRPSYAHIKVNPHKRGSNFGAHRYIAGAAVKVSRYNSNGGYRGSEGIYATTIHELAHTAHYRMDNRFFIGLGSNVTDRKRRRFEKLLLKESYAEGIETILTNRKYLELTNRYGVGPGGARFTGTEYNDNSMQRENLADMDEYTPLFVDLSDATNQQRTGLGRPLDRVSGYTLKQCQDALDDADDLEDFINRLRTKFHNRTENRLDELLGQYNQVVDNND